ncbi:MAG: type II toxin-antitoxin system VapC family toxin [Devosia sp.]|nr:type II toxin-antitoxin system VapC family toxin [Devosia sp.]
MIILDTNVVSEFIRKAPDQRVLGWLDQQADSDLFVTAVTKAEMLSGVAILPEGKRKHALSRDVGDAFDIDLRGKVLPFDDLAADHFGSIIAERQRLGRPMGTMDAQIAAIARSLGAIVATRDVDGFTDCGVELIDPWTA